MAVSNEVAQRPTPWYRREGAIRRFYCAVFEGGGAKGVAFVGALRAMRDAGCWFDQVAGASAGAITASLVAAGLTPEEIEAATADALGTVRTGMWSGIRNLRNETGYFRGGELEKWLDEKFWLQETALTLPRVVDPDDDPEPEPDTQPGPKRRRVTFRKLYQLTGIELHVVAADISLGRQMIFSHLDTPHCPVAAAIAASSAIPFAFESHLLQVPDGQNTFHHTIVDGGVWSNFPMFLFEDPAFREHYDRQPTTIDPDRILGFLLHESQADPPARGQRIKLVRPKGGVVAREWRPVPNMSPPSSEQSPAGLTLAARARRWARELASGLIFPFALLGRFLESVGERGRWPKPRTRLMENVVHAFNGLLGGVHAPIIGLFAFLAIAFGSVNFVGDRVEDLFIKIILTDWGSLESLQELLFSVFMNAAAIALGVLFVAAVGVAMFANRQLIRAVRRILYGLVKTYVAGPGAPAWVIRKPNVIALPIPPTVGTLSFDLPHSVREDLIQSAYDATINKLEQRLAGEGPASHRYTPPDAAKRLDS